MENAGLIFGVAILSVVAMWLAGGPKKTKRQEYKHPNDPYGTDYNCEDQE